MISQTHQSLLRNTNAPRQILHISIRKHHPRRKLKAKHLMDCKDNSLSIFAISFNQASETFGNSIRSDFRVAIKAVSDDWEKCVFDCSLNESFGIDYHVFVVETTNANFEW